MICHEFKGGTGTSSRVVAIEGERFTVGALVQANHGSRAPFVVNGAPVGQELDGDVVPLPALPEAAPAAAPAPSSPSWRPTRR